MSIDINKQIREIYKSYFVELKDKHPELFNRKEFSNIFVTGVLDNWATATNRIMIVGEEAAWSIKNEVSNWGNVEIEIDKSQEYVLDHLKEQIGGEENKYPFWRRFRNLVKKLPENVAYCHTNLDSINSRFGSGKLDPKYREKLHSLKDKLLGGIIEILKPTIVLFCGWSERKDVFKKELTENVYNAFYKYCDKNKHSEHKIYEFKERGICYILSYHPSYSTKRIKGYEEAILETIKKQVKY